MDKFREDCAGGYRRGVLEPTRRDVLTTASLGLGIATVAYCASASAQGEVMRAQPGDVFILAAERGSEALTPQQIPLGGPAVLAWPMEPATKLVRNGSRLNKVLLLRFDPALLAGVTKENAAEGTVAYTAICPHAGCDVTGWLADQQVLECPCHSSQYSPREAGAVIDGPAPRALPALPLKIEGRKLMTAKPFTSRVGFTPPA